jgi:hypothetical protein
MSSALLDFLANSVAEPVHPAVRSMAEHLRLCHEGVQIVLAYGSALRDSDPQNTLIDYYVLTRDLAGVSQSAVARSLCSTIPPNVYYLEHDHAGQIYRAKYAVMPMELLAQKTSNTTSNPYFWARFCQPVRLVFAADDVAEKRILQILERAATTARNHARALAPQAPADAQWAELFRETYQTELRPEDASRADVIVSSQPAHFEKLSSLADFVDVSDVSWPTRRWQGKLLSIARLAKAAFTFQGGADYAAWKIKRHSGVEIEIKDWHRRHPLFASIVLLPYVLRKRGLK